MILTLSFILSLLAILIGFVIYHDVKRKSAGTTKMQSIAKAIEEGAMAYMSAQNKAVFTFGLIIFIIFLLIGFLTTKTSWYGVAISFALGAIMSALAGFIGMKVTTTANVRTAEAAKNGLNSALKLSFKSGLVTGLMVTGLALVGIIGLLFLFYNLGYDIHQITIMVSGMGFGASLVAMFARVGGGIFTKGADVGADLVGKVEVGIPEDDPRNPAVIADNVGDNVGDCAGMGADLFESFVVTLIATMILGNLIYPDLGWKIIIYPIVIATSAIITSLLGSLLVGVKSDKDNPMNGLMKGIYGTAILSAIAFLLITPYFFSGSNTNAYNISLSAIIGLVVGLIIVKITDYYTSYSFKPVLEIARSSQTGAGTTLITGIGIGLESTFPYALTIVSAIVLTYYLAGVYGVTIAALSMLSLSTIILAVDSFGPISDNAGGIAEMAHLSKKIRTITDKLDAVGNTTKATTKGFAIASAGLAAVALILAYAREINLVAQEVLGKQVLDVIGGFPVINLLRPDVLVGAFIGGVIPFLFAAYAMKAVGVSADEIVREVRRQFEDGLIMKGKKKPDYAKCVTISTNAAINELLKLGAVAVLSPLIIGFVFGYSSVAGFLVGTLIVGQFLAVFMCNAGAAWDNAKKYIETGKLGGKGSDTHKSAVVGDTVGDPFKDTAGPSLNPLIKIVNTISILFVVLFIMYSLNLIH